MNFNERLIYTNNVGQTIEFSHFTPYVPLKFSEETNNNIAITKDNAKDGVYVTNNSLESKYVSISGVVTIVTNDIEVHRRELKKIFNPKTKGQLRYSSQTLEKDKIIECIPEEVPTFVNSSGVTNFTISLMCPSPFWEETEKKEEIALLTPLLRFPLTIPINGITFGLKKSILQTEVNNIGDVQSGFRVIFKARGTVHIPTIKNAITGEYIKINYNMGKDEFIEVINYPNKKKITINGTENGFKYLDIGSNFFELEVGKNLIGYSAELNTVNLDVIVYYTPRYLGV